MRQFGKVEIPQSAFINVLKTSVNGEVAEWLKARLESALTKTVSRVRIPLLLFLILKPKHIKASRDFKLAFNTLASYLK